MKRNAIVKRMDRCVGVMDELMHPSVDSARNHPAVKKNSQLLSGPHAKLV